MVSSEQCVGLGRATCDPQYCAACGFRRPVQSYSVPFNFQLHSNGIIVVIEHIEWSLIIIIEKKSTINRS